MKRHLVAIAATAALALAACSSEGDGSAETDPASSPTTQPTEVDEPTSSLPVATSEPGDGPVDEPVDEPVEAASPTLSVGAIPAGASLVVEAAGLTEDRAIVRGAGELVQQGQTFHVDVASALTSVSFTVVAPEAVPAGQAMHLDVYAVADPIALVPSSPVEIGDAGPGVTLALPADLAAGVATPITFEFPAVSLAPGDYAALLSIPTGGAAIELYMQHAVVDEYAAGAAIWFEGSTWKVDRTVGDQAFALVLDA